ncbi:MAG: Lrp/AsnC family transcriptional regulator [Kiritimatiellae bacterium]|nr:Lrp/AsnC family transcriptional regulator [Kiritimatiellia bacterium]
MDPLLKLLRIRARDTDEELARQLGLSTREVADRRAEYERSGVIRGYQAVLNEDALDLDSVTAIIEVKLTPEREGGFNHIAERICRFPEVQHAYLVSGQADLLLFIQGRHLRDVGAFVSEKLAPMTGVTATATSFMLKTYKLNGVGMDMPSDTERLQVSP